jgi:hypothetical protein
MPRPSCTALALAALSAASACLSPGEPGPAPRFFDPLPLFEPAAARGSMPRCRVMAEPYLRQQFTLRTGPRELVFDELHLWMAPPEQLVTAAIERGLFQSGAITALPGERVVHVRRFEFDLQGTPTARVVLQFGPEAGAREFAGAMAAASREPPALAEAMAAALRQAVLALRDGAEP